MSVRVGVVGCGMIAQKLHLPHYRDCPDAEVVAVCDVDEARAKAAAAAFGGAVFTDYHELLEYDLDAVSVCVPNYLHADVTLAAIAAGKHVLCEKPMAITMNDADAMVAAAVAKGVLLMVDHTNRFYPWNEVLKDALDAGLIGALCSVRGRVGHGGPEHWAPGSDWFFDKEQAGAGVMADLGIHCLDLLRWLAGLTVTEVTGMTARLEKAGTVEDNGLCLFRCEHGVVGSMEASWTTRPSIMDLDFYGERGTIHLVSQPQRHVVVQLTAPRAEFTLGIPDKGRNGGPIEHFVRCVVTGAEPVCPGADAARSLEVVLAALRSADESRTLLLPLKR